MTFVRYFVLLPLLVVLRSGVSSRETIGNSTKKEIKSGSNVTRVSNLLQEATKNISLPIRDAAAIVEAPVEINQAREVEKDGVTKIEKKRESQVFGKSKERVKANVRRTDKKEAKGFESLDDREGQTVEHSRYNDEEDDENSHDQDNEEVDDKDNEKRHICKTGIGPDAEDDDDDGDDPHDFEETSSDDEEEKIPRKLKRGEHEANIWDQWGKWSCCSSSCGPGKTTRWRHCVAGGCLSGEKEVQIRSCQIAACLH